MNPGLSFLASSASGTEEHSVTQLTGQSWEQHHGVTKPAANTSTCDHLEAFTLVITAQYNMTDCFTDVHPRRYADYLETDFYRNVIYTDFTSLTLLHLNESTSYSVHEMIIVSMRLTAN